MTKREDDTPKRLSDEQWEHRLENYGNAIAVGHTTIAQECRRQLRADRAAMLQRIEELEGLLARYAKLVAAVGKLIPELVYDALQRDKEGA